MASLLHMQAALPSSQADHTTLLTPPPPRARLIGTTMSRRQSEEQLPAVQSTTYIVHICCSKSATQTDVGKTAVRKQEPSMLSAFAPRCLHTNDQVEQTAASAGTRTYKGGHSGTAPRTSRDARPCWLPPPAAPPRPACALLQQHALS